MCAKYLAGREKSDFQNPVFEISLEGKQAYTLSIFKKAENRDEGVPATSSLNAYPFTLSGDKLGALKKTVAKLNGKEETLRKE